MRVLLINPNRYLFPPVPPIGLEYLASLIEEGGHETRMLDLCFCDTPMDDIDKAVSLFRPDIVGVTVRNIDTVLYQTNEFFLDDIRAVIDHLKSHGLKVIIGGAGVSIDPEGVRKYLGADYVFAGPADKEITDVLDSIRASDPVEELFRRKYRYNISCPRKFDADNYHRYFVRGGIAGFKTHEGCGSSCIYCLEANTPVSVRPISEVVAEIKKFADNGFSRFHLCDSEFNEDLDYCIDFCVALKASEIKIDWALYMKPANYNMKLFKLMKETGVSLITLTIDSWKKCPLYWSDIERIIFSAKSCGIRIVVDFLTGFPYEDDDTLKFYLDLFRRVRPDSVGINSFIRLYKYLPLTGIIMKDPLLNNNIIGDTSESAFIRPVFYNRIGPERIRELICDDPLFRIEGLEKGVNYCRQTYGKDHN